MNNQPKDGDEIVFGVTQICGCLLMMLVSGLSSLAGLGGGRLNITILILFFNILPKNATLMVFACIFGASAGNMINQMRRALDDQPVINYSYASIVIPLMFIGTLFGVLINKFLPSLALVTIIIIIAVREIPGIYRRFKESYRKQTQQLLEDHQNQNKVFIKETKINPFDNHQNRLVFQSILWMIVAYIILSLLKGSEKVPSIIGVQNCSTFFWILQLGIVGLAWYFHKRNTKLYQIEKMPKIELNEPFPEAEDEIDKNSTLLIKNSLGAGMLGGLGLGGGILLVPLYRSLNTTPVQASSTGAFTVFLTSGLNVIQVLSFGALNVSQFLFFFGINCFGSFCISYLLSIWLRKINRTSFVEFLLLFFVTLSSIFLPYSLFAKVQQAGGDWSIILGFGSIC